MRILRRRQQLVVAAGVSPGAQVIGVQIAIHFFQPRHLLGAATVIARNAPRQLAVFHFQLRANQLNAELISPRLEHQRRGCGTDGHLRTGIYLSRHRQNPFGAHQLVPVFFAKGFRLLAQPVFIHARQERFNQHFLQLIARQLATHAVERGQRHAHQAAREVAFTEGKTQERNKAVVVR